jgi:DNA-binding MarR family transcriptional regulator
LEPTQHSLLVACSLAQGATVGQIAEALAMDRSALARNLAIMEKRGLLKVMQGEDRRTRKIALTPLGQATYANSIERWRVAQAQVEQAFGRERLQHLIAELRALTALTQASS